MRAERVNRPRAAGLCVLLLFALPAAATPRVALTLLDAVEQSMRNNPAVAIARAELTLAGGERLQAQGAFDPTLSANLTLQRLQLELSDTRKQGLVDQRDDLQGTIDGIREQRGDAQDELALVVAAQADPLNVQLGNPDAQAALALLNQLIADAPNEQARSQLEALRAEQLATRRGSLESRIAELDEADATETERLRRLGDAPEVEVSHDVVAGASYRRAYRNGWVVEGFSELTVTGANYRGKTRDPEFGGLGVLDLYRSKVGLRLLTPFGRGQQTAAALEQAAISREAAATALIEHRLRLTLLETIGAYWELSAAQAVVDVLADSAERQGRLAALSEALIVADQLPRSERARVQARDAEAAAQLARARQSLTNAQLDLARSIGAEGSDELPFAADALPDAIDHVALDAGQRRPAVRLAQQRRRDYLAARHSAAGRQILAESARGDLRRRHDLLSEISFSGVDEGSRIARQLEGALLGRWTGPSVRLAYNYERPLRDDLVRGVLQQQDALADQAELQASTLRDEIGRRLLSGLDALAEAQRELAARRDAVLAYQDTVAADRERLQLGNATLIDLIQTEDRLTASLLATVAAQSAVARLLVETRFQAGLLAPVDADGEYSLRQRDLVELDPAELLAAP